MYHGQPGFIRYIPWKMPLILGGFMFHAQLPVDTNLLEAVQKRALHWTCGSWWDPSALSWTIPLNVCYKQLNVPLLCDKRNFVSVCLLQDIRHGSVSISFSNIMNITLYQQGVIISTILYNQCKASFLLCVDMFFVEQGTFICIGYWSLCSFLPCTL